jgi:hypothetical protein
LEHRHELPVQLVGVARSFSAAEAPAPSVELNRSCEGRTVMRTLTIKRGNFAAVVYTPDGRTLISLNSHRHVRFWDLTTFTERLSFALPQRYYISKGNLFLVNDLLLVNNGVWIVGDILRRLREEPPRGPSWPPAAATARSACGTSPPARS